MPRSAFAWLVFVLIPGAEPIPKPRVAVTVGKNVIAFHIGDELVTRYHFDPSAAKPYLYPLLAPGDVPLSRDCQGVLLDHPHQKSAWFGHGDVIPHGVDSRTRIKGVQGVDFWSETPGHGKVVCTIVGEPIIRQGRGAIATHNVWKSADGVAILDEDRSIELFALDGGARLIIVRSDLKAAGMKVTFGDTKEGAFGVRVANGLRVGDVKGPANAKSVITLATGETGESQCWGRRGDWCDYSGVVDGKPVGIAMFDDSANRPRACWHVRNYGLMAANPFGRWAHAAFPAQRETPEPVTELLPGATLRLRYGLLLHSGDAKTGQVAEMYRKFLTLVE